MVKTAFSQSEETVLKEFVVINGNRMHSQEEIIPPSETNTYSFPEPLSFPHFSSTAMHSISTSTFFGKVFTATQLLAGFGSPKA
jgi:hypothetical protein